jgi:cephalosporin-C deacetylase-like acetyl esterase
MECDGFSLEKVVFEARPGVFVTANLYLPDGIESPRGAVQFLCGHAYEAKQYPEYQIVCQYLVKAGLVVLAQDPVGQGERLSYYEPGRGGTTVEWGTTEHDYAGTQCLPLGDTIGRYFVHDAMRGIDYLCSRREVDPSRIGVTGNSGGGTQTSMMMVCDPRLAAAAPATFIMDRRTWLHSGGAQDAEQIWPGTTALGFDHEDILLAMAPKPVLVLALQWDFFPIEGARRTVQRVKRVWELLGEGDKIGLVEDTSRHAYTRRLARAAAEFFSHHLLGRTVTADDIAVEPLPLEQLNCTASGQVRGELAGARFVQEENCDRLAEAQRDREARPEAERKAEALAWLREQVLRGRRPCDLNPREYTVGRMEEMDVAWYLWWSQEGLFNHGVVFRHHAQAREPRPVTLAIWPGGTTDLHPHLTWIRQTCAADRAVMVLDPTGVGNVAPHSGGDPLAQYGVIRKLNDDLVWLNDSLAAMRTYDVTRAVEVLPLLPDLRQEDVRVYGCGRYAVYGQFAAALDSRIRGIEIAAGLGSYADWVGARHYDRHDIRSVILPGVLRQFDLPELGGGGEGGTPR